MLGIILIIIGIIAIIAGIGGGIAKMFLEIKQQSKQASSFGTLDTLLPDKTIEALTKFLEALTKAPIWLALIIIGIVLIAWGGAML